ncbi:MAG: hypothetical protein A2Y74_07660 [Actinobacteria bacterium RBG_13_63_9]|nr:MAG: hypothetical protein A2Y74_07660 [Actinobacteria bacterium RBG_13_63_9]
MPADANDIRSASSAELDRVWRAEFRTLLERREAPSEQSRTSALFFGVGFPFGTAAPLPCIAINSALHEVLELQEALRGRHVHPVLCERLERAHEDAGGYAVHHLCTLVWKLQAVDVATGSRGYDEVDWANLFVLGMSSHGDLRLGLELLETTRAQVTSLFQTYPNRDLCRQTLKNTVSTLGRIASCAGASTSDLVAEEQEPERTQTSTERLRQYVERKERGPEGRRAVFGLFIDAASEADRQSKAVLKRNGALVEHFAWRTLVPPETAYVEFWCSVPHEKDSEDFVAALKAANIDGLLSVETAPVSGLLATSDMLAYEALVRDVLDALPKPEPKRGTTAQPDWGIEDLAPPEHLRAMEECARRVFQTLCPHMPVTIQPAERMAMKGYASRRPIIVTLQIPAVFKIGDEELSKQYTAMSRYPDGWQRLFPHKFTRLVRHGRVCALLMEDLGGNELFRLMFLGPCDRRQIARALGAVFNTLEPLYETHMNRNECPNLKRVYVERIRERVAAAEGRIGELAGISGRWRDFLTEKGLSRLAVRLDGTDLRPLDACMPGDDLAGLVEMVPATVVHGDLHLNNIFVIPDGDGFQVRLIDPNEEMLRGDFLYDMGKLVHLLDDVWMAPWEEVRPKPHLFELQLEQSDEGLVAHIEADRTDEKFLLAGHALALVESYVKERCTSWGDQHWQARLALSRASACLGLLTRFTNFRHFLLAFLKGLAALNEFARLADR